MWKVPEFTHMLKYTRNRNKSLYIILPLTQIVRLVWCLLMETCKPNGGRELEDRRKGPSRCI